ncbi:uncharacterized protein N7479_001229 [Penicillium vulpinum]|uniref:Uncharacterized protein n=1 Tax=Penicillium vulpinum TaxID=29845 RepID=A0A1V6S090_9EURO|nr:uncharacterized protein N7479_001229 [Penicillium vulpinum]KAJ5971311.1 hypothetical protein N7479_001229 [Penicillium vulpinum]OQE07140.1 hypothetical protein PENVUL_c015G08032 [Penicillium vulpinum]
MSSGTQLDTNPGETMRLAVERFRTKMESSNRQFIQDRINEIEAMHLSTEKEKLRIMSRYWDNLGDKGQSNWSDDAPRDMVRQAREMANVSRLQDLKTTFHEHMDGVNPTTLVTDEWRQMFLETLESVCNKAAEKYGDHNFHIPICDDLGHFIKYANGVQDPDFRHSGICPWKPVPYIGIRHYAFPDRPSIRALPLPDIAKSRDQLKRYLEYSLLGEDFIYSTFDKDLEVKVGLHTGCGLRRGYDEWYSAYVYCRRYEDDPDPSHKDWAWRVVIFHAGGANPTL